MRNELFEMSAEYFGTQNIINFKSYTTPLRDADRQSEMKIMKYSLFILWDTRRYLDTRDK